MAPTKLTLKQQASLLLKNKKWDELRSWFYYAHSLEERAEKVLIWSRLFLPDYFYNSSPPFHREILMKLFSEGNEYNAAPRGFAKTTVIQAGVAFMVAYGLKHFIVILEKTGTESNEVLDVIRDIFKHNEAIKSLYGDLIKRDAAGVYDQKNKDAQNDLLINGVRLRGKGFNTPVRGLKSKSHRPDLIICDDVEEDEHIRSQEQRQKYYDNLTTGVIPAVDVNGCIKMFGTILHYDSLLNNQVKLHNGTIYAAYDENDPENTLLWPQRWTYAKLEAKRLEMMQEGKGSASFYKEYLNKPVDDSTRAFKWEWLQKTYRESDLVNQPINIYVILDVADSVKDRSDFTGEVKLKVNPDNQWFIARAKRNKFNITGLIERIFDIWIYDKPIAIGIEKKALEDQIRPLLKIEAKKRNVYPTVIELKHGGTAKEARIKGALQGRFEYGMISFLEDANDDQGLLRSELYDFPSSKHDDLSDALAYGDQFVYEPFAKDQRQPKEQADMDMHLADAIDGIEENEPQSWMDY